MMFPSGLPRWLTSSIFVGFLIFYTTVIYPPLPHGPVLVVPRTEKEGATPGFRWPILYDSSRDTNKDGHETVDISDESKLEKWHFDHLVRGEYRNVAPETVAIQPHTNTPFIFVGGNNSLLSFSPSREGEAWGLKKEVLATIPGGRVLGSKFTKDGDTLYAAVTGIGLVRVTNLRPKKWSKLPDVGVEVVATGFYDTRSDCGDINSCGGEIFESNKIWSDIRLADDVDIGPKTGHVYFSDASNIAPEYDSKIQNFDAQGAFVKDFMRGKASGRLLRYNPKNGKIDVLVDDIWFANGVAVDREESFVLVASTSSSRLLKHHITGPKAGTTESIPSGFLIDGLDCSHVTGKCYAALPTKTPPILKILSSMPPSVNAWLRMMILMLPKKMQPKAELYGGLLEFLPDDCSNDCQTSQINIVRILEDPTGLGIAHITGVTEHMGKLYLGSLDNHHIGVYKL